MGEVTQELIRKNAIRYDLDSIFEEYLNEFGAVELVNHLNMLTIKKLLKRIELKEI